MQKMTVSILMLVFAAFFPGCSPEISPQEAKVLVTLGEIQRGLEANIDYGQFLQLLKTTQAEIDLLKQSNKPNACFLSAAERAYASYEITGKAWQKKLQTQDERRKADLEMTIAFSLSFSAINIERANKCYE